jgi:N-acetyl-anhydromuramyl-L-alanine amidase AmpD
VRREAGAMIAEVPFALWVPAHPSNYRARPADALTPYSLGVQHITSGHPDAMAVAQMWQCPAGSKTNPKGTSCTFVIGQDGTLIQCVSLRFAAQHAHVVNGISYGVEYCARERGEFGPDDPGMPITPVQYAVGAKLNAYLCKAAGYEPVLHLNIRGHAEADPTTTHTRCPDGVAGGFDWDTLMTMMKTAYAEIGAPPALV